MKKNATRLPFLYQISFALLVFLLHTTSGQGQVVINELGIAPPCTSCNAAGGGEFIELFNKGCTSVDLSCHVIVWTGLSGGGNPTGWTISIPNGTTIAPCTYYVIGGSGNSPATSWSACAIGGSVWNNPAGPVNLNISTTYNTGLQNCKPGNIVDTQGQLSLLDATGAVITSVSYNLGNDAASYAGSFSQAPPGCTALNPINSLPNAAQDVTGSFGGGAGKDHGIELHSDGLYYTVTTAGTPGSANPSQLACSAGGPTALALTHTNAHCGSNNGSVTLGATTGGTAPFTYNFNGLGYSSTTTYSNLASGTYPVLVKDANGCIYSTSVIITSNPGPTALATTPANSSCGGTTGTVTIGATTGGSGPFTYNFNSLGFSSVTTYNNLAAGTYPVIVKDANGCTFSTTVTVGNNTAPTALATTPTPANCGANTGSVVLGATTGGTGPYTYNFNSLGFSATTTYSNLAPGTYTVIVKDSHGCTFTTSATVGSNPGPTALTTTPSNSSCGGATGSVIIGATTGGTGPYTYNFNSLGFAGTTTFNGLGAGAYTVIVKDAHGCTFTTTSTVGNNSAPTAVATTPSNASCSGANGTVSIGVTTGGTGPYTYNFNNLGFSATTVYNNLMAGTYPLVVKDVNGCIFSTTVTVGSNVGPTAQVVTPTGETCGAGNGSVTLGATTNGTGPFTYNFNNLGFSATTAYANISAGTYPVVVKDANGCTYSTTVTLTNSSGPTIASSLGTNSLCTAGCIGAASVTISGGTGIMTYSWLPSGGNTATTPGTLCAGSYTCTVTDSNGCVVKQIIALTDPAPLVVSTLSSTPATCNTSNGTATLNVTGGTPGYFYSWSPGGATTSSVTGLAAGSYIVSVADANSCPNSYTLTINNSGGPAATLNASADVTCNLSCNGSASVNATGGTGAYTYSWSPSGGTSNSATGLCAGSYVCSIRDSNNCLASQSVLINQPGALGVTGSTTAVKCNGGSSGSANVVVAGGTVNYTYSWSGSGSTTAVATGLSVGNYTCMITDGNGCKDSTTFAVTQPTLLSSSASVTGATCGNANGSASTTTTGGTGAYTYSWSPSAGAGNSLSNIGVGTYYCMVTDSNGCAKTDTALISNAGLPPIATITASGTTAICQGTDVLLLAGGGGTYSWSTGATTDSIRVSAAGTYTVTVINTCGTSPAMQVVSVKPLPVGVVNGSSNVCSGDSVMLSASGGSTYVWNTGSTSSSIYVSVQGIYTVIVGNTCGTSTVTSSLTVNSITANYTADSTAGYVPFNVLFTNTSSASATNWAWNFGDGNFGSGQNPNHLYTTAGTYTATLTVTDANGCTSTFKEIIVVSDLPSWIIVPNVFTPNGDASNDLFLCKSQGISTFDMKIYDRWGLEMTEISGVNEGWDGRTRAGVPATDGTYYYIIHATGDDKKSYDFKGYLQLIH
jgi:gliding motility-associated-like protein